jgi:hypothetical protein
MTMLIHHLSRRNAIVDAIAALVMFAFAFLIWLFFISRISLINYNSNDLLILGSYALIFFVGFVVAPLLLISGKQRPIHYTQAIVAPLRWELDLWRKKRWLFDEYELRKIINGSDDSLIKHNLSLIYRNLLLSLPAYGLHSISTIFYYGEHAIQISILTATIIIALLIDVARRAKRIYVIIGRQEAPYDKHGPRSGPLGSADRWSSTEERALANRDKDLVVAEKASEFAGPEFDALLDDETKDVLAKIKGRSQEEVAQGLVRTGVFTKDGRLTKKYGGTH